MTRIATFLALVLAFTSGQSETVDSNGFTIAISPAPAWVGAIERPTAGAVPGESGIALLLKDVQYDFSDKPYKRFARIALEVSAPQGLDAAANLQASFDPNYQSFTLHSIIVQRGNEMLDRTRSSQITLARREQSFDASLYDGRISVLTILDDVRVGDVVEWSYSVDGTNPVLGDRISLVDYSATTLPIGLFNLRVITEKSRKFDYRSTGDAVKPKISSKGDRTVYTWQAKETPVTRDDGEYPVWFNPFPRIMLTEYFGWSDVVTWALDLYKVPENPKHGIQAGSLDAALIGPNASQLEALESALRFVQDEIRYFGIELGENSHRPSQPHETLERRFGDCKDKTVLLRSILDQHGIKSWPALVATNIGTGLADYLPSPALFDHVILMVEIDGEIQWVDPTLTMQRGNLDSVGFPDYGLALPIRSGQSELVLMKRPAGTVNRATVAEHFVTEELVNDAELKVESKFSGWIADSMRRRLGSATEVELRDHAREFYQRLFGVVSQQDTIQTSDNDRDWYVTQQSHLLNGLWEPAQQYLRAEFSAHVFSDFLSMPLVIDRNGPLAISHPIELVHEITVDVPNGALISEEAEVLLESEFMKYQRTIVQEGTETSIRHVLTSKQDHVPSSAIRDHVRFLREMDRSLGTVILANMLEEDRFESQDDRLKTLLRKLRDGKGQ